MPETRVPSPSADRMPQLDGLRGAAVLCVIWHHFGVHLPSWLDWGPVAPSVFMVLSGYLITRSLMKMRDSTNGPGLVSYHARRITRLLPALYVMLAVGWLVGLEEFQENLFWHATFMSNVHMAVTDEWTGFLSHLWSLAMQEQFYLIWPLILLLPTRWLPPVLLGAYAGAAIFRLWCLHAGMPDMFRWFMLPGSLDAFGAGGIVAWLQRSRQGEPIIPRNWRWPVAIFALGCWMFSRHLRELHGTGSMGIAFVETFETVLFGWLLIELLQNGKGWISGLFSAGALVGIGRISYGVYLWHMMVLHALGPHLDNSGLSQAFHGIPRLVILTAASVGVAFLSWIALERPFIAWGKRVNLPKGWFGVAWARVAKFLAKPERV